MARALAVLVLAALAVPAAAAAHARLIRTVPGSGSVLAHAPAVVRVEFDDTVRVAGGNAVVANTTRASVLAGPAHADGRVLTLPLVRALARGAYTVRWSVVAEDGHREEGVLAFAVGRGTPVPVLVAASSVGARGVALRTLYDLGLLAACGAAVFALLSRRLLGARLRRPLAALLFATLLAAFVGASGLEATAASGTRFALVLRVAIAIAAAGAATAALAPAYPPLLAISVLCALALSACPALAGHALDRDQPVVLSAALDIAHTIAAGIWLGGLVAALWLLPRTAADTWERRAVMRRFSTTALLAVALLAASGIGRALTELGGVDRLWTTWYGRMLLLKSAILVPLLLLARRSRSLLERRSQLARSVTAELALIAAIVVVVGVLTELRPGREAPARSAALVRSGFGALAGAPRLALDRLEEARSVLERRQP